MTSTEEKLARELGFRVNAHGQVVTPDGFVGPGGNSYAEMLWRKCLELTKQRECGGGSLSPREWLDARYGSTPPIGEWQWTDEIVEAYASSRLAEVSEQRDALQQALDMLGGPRRCENCATLCAEVTELRAEVERLTRQYEGAKTVNADLAIEIAELKEALAGLKGERDAADKEATQYATDLTNFEDEIADALELGESYEVDELAAKVKKQTAALSQAQQALRNFYELFDDEGHVHEQYEDQLSVAMEMTEKIINPSKPGCACNCHKPGYESAGAETCAELGKPCCEAALPSDAPEATK